MTMTSLCSKLHSAKQKERSKDIAENIKKNINKLKEKDN